MVGVRRKPWMEGQIIISEHWNHNATSLCHDEMGYGPDFIGSDGYMCDMDKREVVPVCSFHEADGCVEVDTNTKALIKRSNLMKRGEDTEYKNYEHIALWK